MNSKTIADMDIHPNKRETWAKAAGLHPATLLFAVLTMLLLGAFAPAAHASLTNNTTPPFLQAPPVGADTSAGFLLVIESGGSLRIKNDPTQGPYDNIEDTLVAVQNNSSKKISSIPLSGFQDIFGFDGDGIDSVTPHPAGAPFGPTGYEGPGTSFSNISADRRSGIVHFNPAIPPGGSAYFALEEALVSSCPGLTPPPRLLQGDTNWAGNKLGTSQATIGGYGCYITSSAMMINYHASDQSLVFRTDPAQLAAWLAATNGFDASGNVVAGGEALIAQYARANGVQLKYTGMVDHRDDFTLDQYLCNGQPPVIYVGNPHWVLCTGQTNVSGTETYSTVDPDSYPNGDTLLGGFGDTYGAIDTYSSSSGELSGLYFVAHSPIELVLTAPDGGEKGVNATTGAHLDTISGAGYKEFTIVNDENHALKSLPKIKRLNVADPSDGTYLLTIYGTGTGAYTIDIAADDISGNRVKKVIKGIATKGSRTCFVIQYQSDSDPIFTINPGPCAGSSIDELISTVKSAGKSGGMNPKASVRLGLLLKAAKAALEQGNSNNARSSLNAFIQAVGVYAGKTKPLIPQDLAGSLIADAQALIQ